MASPATATERFLLVKAHKPWKIHTIYLFFWPYRGKRRYQYAFNFTMKFTSIQAESLRSSTFNHVR